MVAYTGGLILIKKSFVSTIRSPLWKRKFIIRPAVRHVSFKLPQSFKQEWQNTSLVQVEECRRFMMDCLQKLGVSCVKSRCIADVMVAADYRGLFNCGLHRLELYLTDIYKKFVDIHAVPSIISETVCSAFVDGKCAPGPLVANFCMDLAVRKVRQSGIGMVVTKRSHYYGMGAWYAFRAMQYGYLGIVMSNGWPLLVPPRARHACIGSNCLSMGAKALNGHFMLDMATTVKEIGWIDFAFLRNDFLPNDIGTDERGCSTPFPSILLNSQNLCPAGGHKGYCLSVLIDILCGVLSGANYGMLVPNFMQMSRNSRSNLGQMFIAIDPRFFLPNFTERLEDFLWRLLQSKSTDENKSVMVPGEPERSHMSYVADLKAIPMPNVLLAKYQTIARMLCVKPIQTGFV